MKKHRKILMFIMLLIIASITLPATMALADSHEPEDIVDTAIAADDFTVLVEAVQAAGLEEALRGEGPFTVFAPTDEAFADLLAELGLTKEELLNSDDLADILLYHVLPVKVMSQDIVDDNITSATTLQGSDVSIDVKWQRFAKWRKIFVNDARVITPDIECSNGVIHVINKVLIP